MPNDPTWDLIVAVRARLITDATLSRTGVYLGRPPRGDSGSFVRISIQNERAVQYFSRLGHWQVDVGVIAGAGEVAGASAEATAFNLRNIAYGLLDGGTDAVRQAALAAINATLAARGWSVMIPLAAMGVPVYPDYVGDVVRVQTGHIYHFRIQPL